MTHDPFDELLDWLDPADRARAGEKYETIRLSLIKILTWGGCVDAEDMADEAFNRVAGRVLELKKTYKGDPALYFYGVAKMLIKECRRNSLTHVPLEEAGEPEAPRVEEIGKEEESPPRERGCLRHCLEQLNPRDRELILAYYAKDKQAKIDHRKELARRLGVMSNALRVRVYRIRGALEDCIERCLREKTPDEMD
ncbi:MAG TPA: sigma-70 family RNA polymerase sigma factor [Pyrinomonadaceae bacterium]